jgi:hypothetical protein
MSKPWKAVLGVLSGLFALAQFVRLVIRLSSPDPDPLSAPDLAFQTGQRLGNVAGIAIGLGLCVYWLCGAYLEASPFRRRPPNAKGGAWDNGRRKTRRTRASGAITGSAGRPWDKGDQQRDESQHDGTGEARPA